ncbi:MAG TPA: circularly permuted type 2 ATP-grasp protein, partial [Actinomycetes bacterium]|nr:circularly permuted type 2 ATP-grasp protein [Actinomycetes bacterium]
MGDLLAGYDRAGFLDEALDGGGEPSPLYRRLLGALDELGVDALHSRAELRNRLQHLRGVTFTISGEDGERERTLPLDLVPRVIDAAEWALVEAGLVQRVRALNAFVADVYAERRVLRDRVVPPRLVL